ncbi:MAG: FHA domain-containing protein [Verrucomicrobiia bacterium]
MRVCSGAGPQSPQGLTGRHTVASKTGGSDGLTGFEPLRKVAFTASWRRSMYHLIIENGTREGECIQPKGAELSIGRDPGNTLRLVDDGISGRHCVIRLTRRGIVVRDCKSTNGVYVNGKPINEETRLSSGSLVEVGMVAMRFEFLHNVDSHKLRTTLLFWMAAAMVTLTFSIQIAGIGLAFWTRYHRFTPADTAAVLRWFPLPPDLPGALPPAVVQPNPAAPVAPASNQVRF